MYSTERGDPGFRWRIENSDFPTFTEQLPLHKLPPCIGRYLTEGVHDEPGEVGSRLRKLVMHEVMCCLRPLYAEGKEEEAFEAIIEEANRARFFPPLDSDEMLDVENTFAEDLQLMYCSGVLTRYCNQTLCESREFGVLHHWG